MAIASGGLQHRVQLTLDELALSALFNALVTIEDVGKPKPEPNPFLEAARRLNIPATECLVFENSWQGLEAAQRTRMTVVDIRDLI